MEKIRRSQWVKQDKALEHRANSQAAHTNKLLKTACSKLTVKQKESIRRKLFIKQDGRCAICGRPEKELKHKLSLDHCHDSGLCRGLLCGTCNTLLGMAHDDIHILQNAISYLF